MTTSILHRNRRSHTYFCRVTKTIEAVPLRKSYQWLGGGLFHVLPVILVAALLVFFRDRRVTADRNEISAMLLATAWVFLGPCLIRHFERYVLPSFNKAAQEILVDRKQKSKLKRAVFSGIYSSGRCRAITIVWLILLVVGLVLSKRFLNHFGVSASIKDPFWWLILAGTLMVGYFTSIGLCLSYKAISLTRMIAGFEFRSDADHEDGLFGLRFIGEFAFKTTLMFYSGCLFVPLIVLLGHEDAYGQYSIMTPLLGAYAIFAAALFAGPIYIIHRRIVLEKNRRLCPCIAVTNEALHQILNQWSDTESRRFEFFAGVSSRIRTMSEWPLSLNVLVKFVATSVMIPVLVAVISALLKR